MLSLRRAKGQTVAPAAPDVAQPRTTAIQATTCHLALVDEEREWVRRIRDGDETAFQPLFRAYYDPLCRFVDCFVRRPDISEELVQSLFLRLWVKRAQLSIQQAIRTYLYRAARNISLNHLLRERVYNALLARSAGQADHGEWYGEIPESDARVRASDVEDRVLSAIGALPLRYRPVLALRWEHGMTYAEIARILRLPVKTVETRAARAVRMLQPMLRHLR
jgi:RNA polymerase sigma-70 factor (ECF subfamily)